MSDSTPPPGPSDPYGSQDPAAPPPPPPPPPAYGQQNPYGAPAPAYGTPYPGYGYPQAAYAGWGKRVGAYFIDAIISAVISIPFYAGYFWIISGINTTTDSYGNVTTQGSDISPAAVGLTVIGGLITLAFGIWNLLVKQGRTGYTIGKGVLGIKLVKLETGQPIGVGMTFLRQVCHVLDSLACYIGWFWPLWDEKRQTFADKIVGTLVVDAPK